MKRPLFVLGATVLSGTLAGLPEAKGVIKAAMCLAGIAILYLAYKKSRGSRTSLLFCALSFVCGIFSFVHARGIARELSGEAYREFYERYEATNPGQFDYSLYLKSLGITNEEERKLLSENVLQGNEIKNVLGRARESLGGILTALMPEPDNGIYKAMLLGDKTDMDAGVKNLYQESGIAHILAVSGLHISLIGAGIYHLFRECFRLPGLTACLVSAFFTFLYAFFTGGSASAIRAAVMLSLSLFGVQCGRTADSLSSLCAAGILLLFFRPYLLLQSGFQLSFLAILGLWAANSLKAESVSVTTDPGKKSGWMEKMIKVFWSAFFPGLCVTLVTMPVIASSYYSVPLYSVFLNLLVIPLMSVVMISGICALLFGAVSYFLFGRGVLLPARIAELLADISVSPGHYILRLYEKLCLLFSKIPYSQIVTGSPGAVRCVLYAFFLGLSYYVLLRKKGKSGLKRGLAAVLLLTGIFLLRVHKTDEFYVSCLDVGQGDCFHIHKGNTDILIDGGSQRYEKVGENLIEPYLLSQGITDLELVIVSHADADHVNGLYYLLSPESEVLVKTLMLPALSEKDEKYDRLKEAFGHEQKTVTAKEGMSLKGDGIRLSCVYCNQNEEALSDTNRQSAVFLLETDGVRMLFCGDISEREEKELIRMYEGSGLLRNIQVLKASHHGSKTASCREFIEFTDPEYVVLSYKKGNSYGHPDREVLDRFTENGTGLLRTAESGAVKITSGKEELRIESFKMKGGMR